MFNIFKSQEKSTNESETKKEYIPNRHVGETKKMGIYEDDYTIAERKRKLTEAVKIDSKDNLFIDASGRKTKISDLNGQTKQLLAEARSAIQEEAATTNDLKIEGDIEENDETVEILKNKIRRSIHKADHRTSMDNFYSGHARTMDGERIGTKLGLYKDYNPKINAGAPGNRIEEVRQAKREAEKTKGEHQFEEPDFNDFLPEIKEED